jgi:hypothetical protein
MDDDGNIDVTVTDNHTTADFMADCVEEYLNGARLDGVRTVVINADNGPENHSRRRNFSSAWWNCRQGRTLRWYWRTCLVYTVAFSWKDCPVTVERDLIETMGDAVD